MLAVLALKKSFRMPNEPEKPDPYMEDYFHSVLAKRLNYIFKEINVKEEYHDYDFNWEFDQEDYEDMFQVDITGLEEEYYILVREGDEYGEIDGGEGASYYFGDDTKKRDNYDPLDNEPLYQRYGNVYERKNIYEDILILLMFYSVHGIPPPPN